MIGAGAAGLAAARELSGAGRRVAVVEARERIGGRIFTLHQPDFPLPIELGAELIHGEVVDRQRPACRAFNSETSLTSKAQSDRLCCNHIRRRSHAP